MSVMLTQGSYERRRRTNVENTRFDALARRLGAAATRRSTLKSLVAIVAGGSLASTIDNASAGTDAPDRTVRTCRVSGYFCTRDSQCCGNDSGRCLTGRQAPRKMRNRCACIANQDTGCWRDTDCCGFGGSQGEGRQGEFTCNWWFADGDNSGPGGDQNGGLCCIRIGDYDCKTNADCCDVGTNTYCDTSGERNECKAGSGV